MPTPCEAWPRCFLPRAGLQDLIQNLNVQGYTVIAPTRHGAALALTPITATSQMAQGLMDEQEGGSYRLSPADPELCFQYVVGPESPKRYLFPAQQRLCQLRVAGTAFVLDAGPPPTPKLAFLGVRPCDVAAMAVQDRVFSAGDPQPLRCEAETYYAAARQQALVIVVNCTRPAATCFCNSMGTGPEAIKGFDLSLTELRDGFVLTVGSARGRALADVLPTRAASVTERELAELRLARAREHMGRRLETEGLKETLNQAVEHPQWDQVATRCLSCGNCTLVCPTCFCFTVSDHTTLADPQVTREREWASCFALEFSYTTAGPVRHTIRGRYRHWLRHKLGTWWDQFGCSGCVGCGRCITWCPVGIDLTAEVRQIRSSQSAVASGSTAKETPR